MKDRAASERAELDLRIAEEWFPDRRGERGTGKGKWLDRSGGCRRSWISIPRSEPRFRKTRPALVIRNDIDNRHSPITIVAAISSQIAWRAATHRGRASASGGGLTRPSVVLLNQIRSVDKRRLVGRLGRFEATVLLRVTGRFRSLSASSTCRTIGRVSPARCSGPRYNPPAAHANSDA